MTGANELITPSQLIVHPDCHPRSEEVNVDGPSSTTHSQENDIVVAESERRTGQHVRKKLMYSIFIFDKNDSLKNLQFSSVDCADE